MEQSVSRSEFELIDDSTIDQSSESVGEIDLRDVDQGDCRTAGSYFQSSEGNEYRACLEDE